MSNKPVLDGRVPNQPNDAVFTIGDEATDVINVAVQLNQGANAIGGKAVVMAYLSSDAAGDTPVATADTVAIGTDGSLVSIVSKELFMVRSEDDGTFDINVTEATASTTYYLNVVMPDGSVVTSDAITFA